MTGGRTSRRCRAFRRSPARSPTTGTIGARRRSWLDARTYDIKSVFPSVTKRSSHLKRRRLVIVVSIGDAHTAPCSSVRAWLSMPRSMGRVSLLLAPRWRLGNQRAAGFGIPGIGAGIEDILDRLYRATASLPKIATFRDWLLAEALNDLRQLESLTGTSKRKPR